MVRYLYLAVGFGFVALALLGIALPVLPTTPFLLVAAACFARSSRRCHRWLLNNRLFGPMIDNWQRKRCIAKKTKRFAQLSIAGVGGTSVVIMLEHGYLKLLALALLAVGFYVVSSLTTCPDITSSSEADNEKKS